ncbi:hypothetical protein K474DRAFT_1662018 [Panus rudis PR-1116 ss-1]|nr:hypothetical protein K474DRAFT_1662018 [Panus rudis PR-1116 ss-1]
MSTEEPQQAPKDANHDEVMRPDPPTAPAAMATANRKRPRLDLTVEPRERKRGKTMFGVLLGTLNKAKNEDKQRNASEAAKKRQEIEQSIQDKLRRETDSVRRAEEAKKDKTTANRKEEELQLKDSIYKLRRKRLPLLANFLSTADRIPSEDDSSPPSTNPLALHPKSQPAPLYYLPVILTPAQEAFLKRRKVEVKEAAEKEWETFRQERAEGIEEIMKLRRRVAEEESKKPTTDEESPSKPDVASQPPQPKSTEADGGEEDVKMGDQEPPKSSEAPPSAPAEPVESEPPAPAPAAPSEPPTNGDADTKKEPPQADEAPLSAKDSATEMQVDDGPEKPVAGNNEEPSSKEGTSGEPESSAAAATTPAATAPATAAPAVQAIRADEDDAVEY